MPRWHITSIATFEAVHVIDAETADQAIAILLDTDPVSPLSPLYITLLDVTDICAAPDIRRCRGCGCTDRAACLTEDGPCHWVEPELCSACASSALRSIAT